MTFPAGIATQLARFRMASAAATVLLAAGLLAAGASHADPVPPPPPSLKNVKYTLTAERPIYADIYYLDQEPGNFAQYSNNPYRFSPNVEVDVGPNQSWVYELQMAQPEHYAFISASTGPRPFGEPGAPNFHCKLAVDGVVVVERDGPRGVLCSIRPW
jgi:hypothetical protein